MKTIEDLYDGLFATLTGLQDGTIKPDTALAVATVAQTIINAAKVECDYAKINRQRGTHFVPLLTSEPQPAPTLAIPAAAPAIAPAEPAHAEPKNEPAQPSTPPAKQHEITEVGGFKVGQRVECPNGKGGTISKVTTSGRIDVKEDGGGTFPYSARHLKHETTAERPKITSPLVPPRFVAGRAASGSA